VWGILNAPATGEAMAELIVDGAARAVDLAPFDVGGLPSFAPSKYRSTGSGLGMPDRCLKSSNTKREPSIQDLTPCRDDPMS